MWVFRESSHEAMGVDFGRFGLKGSHKTPSLTKTKTIKMVVVTHWIPSPGMIPSRIRTWGVARCFSNKRNLKKKNTEFLPLKKRSIMIKPIYIDHYMKQSVLVECHQRGLGNHFFQKFAIRPPTQTTTGLSVIWVTEFWWVRVGVPIFFSRMSPKKQDWDMAQKCRQNDQIYLEIYLQKREVDLASLTIKPVVGTLKRSWMEFRRSWKTGCRTFFSSTAYQ